MTCEATYHRDAGSVRFAIYPDGFDGPRILAEVSGEVLRDVFGALGGADGLVRACADHITSMEAQALAHYRREPAKAVRLQMEDFGGIAAASNASPF